MEAWQKAMQEAHEQAEPQYRLIPTDMIPGLKKNLDEISNFEIFE